MKARERNFAEVNICLIFTQLGDEKIKSGTIDNNHNPVWHFTALLTVLHDDDRVKITVFDDDIGKDDFLGETYLSVEELRRSGEITNQVFNLEKCKSGEGVVKEDFS